MSVALVLIPFLVGIVAQISKSILNRNWLTESKIHGHRLPRYGGMPSAHTAFAFSLATLSLLVEGVQSISFAIAAALVILLLDDALRMRVYISRHGGAIQQLINRLPEAERTQFPHLEERLGHSLPEVGAGAILGIVLTYLLHLFFI